MPAFTFMNKMEAGWEMLNVHLLTNLAICHRHRPKKKKTHLGLAKGFLPV